MLTMNEQAIIAMARKLAPDVLKTLARIVKDSKASPLNRSRARKQLELRRAQLRQLADEPNLRADVRGDVECALRAIPENV
jgi:hypothetical protein